MRKALAFALWLAAPAVALAVPPDARLLLAPGEQRFLKLHFAPKAVVVEPRGALQAESFGLPELFLSAPRPTKGPAYVFASGSDGVYVIDVCVEDDPAACPAETSLDSAKAACPGLRRASEDGEPVWQADVKSASCLDALRAALSHATVPARELRLVLDEAPAAEMYKRIYAALAADADTAHLRASFYGATMRLQGEATLAQVARAAALAWPHTLGRLTFEDLTKRVEPPRSDAPPPPAVRVLPAPSAPSQDPSQEKP